MRIRVFDIDTGRLMSLERIVQLAIKRAGVKADLVPVGDRLEITRCRLINTLPALEINGRIVSKGELLEPEEVEWIIRENMP